MTQPAMTSPRHTSSGARVASIEAKALPLRRASVTVSARAGLARVVYEQHFENPHDVPLSVTYTMPLPADGAVSGYAFRIGDRRIVGEVDRRERARERFEEAVMEGKTAGLVEQERSSLFTQQLGNIPPGESVVAEIVVDQRLSWLADGYWEWRFPLASAPRYLGQEGRVHDAKRVTMDVAPAALEPRASLHMNIRDATSSGRSPESPSHALSCSAEGDGHMVELGNGGEAALDRDLVVRWPVAQPKPGVTIDLAGSAGGASAFGLLTVVPPSLTTEPTPVSRDLILLLDTSGSMYGEPMEQARRIASALVDQLGDHDTLEMIAFASAPTRWQRTPAAATKNMRQAALRWLAQLRSGGSTEMVDGILEALKPVRPGSQRQVVLVTDGLIGFEQEVVRAIVDELPRGSRLHTVGVGSSVNRSLLGPAARAGRGVEVILGLGEDPERAVKRLSARTYAPLLVDLQVSGSAVMSTAPSKLPDLFAESPALVALQLRAEGGEVRLEGRLPDGAVWGQRIVVDPGATEERSDSNGHPYRTVRSEARPQIPAVAALYGRENVEDLELQVAAGGHTYALDQQIERIGLEFQIATRMTSWIALTKHATVDPRTPFKKEVMPQQLPFGMSAEGVGLRQPMGGELIAGQGGADVLYSLSEVSGEMYDDEEAFAAQAEAPLERTRAGVMRKQRFASTPRSDLRARMGRVSSEGPAGKSDEDEIRVEVANEMVGGRADSLWKRMKGAVQDWFEPESKEEDELEAAASGLKRLQGRLVLITPARVIIEIDIDEATEWDPERATVILLDTDGSEFSIPLDLSATTAVLPAGEAGTVRLVLDCATRSMPIVLRLLRLELPSGAVVVELDS